MIEIKSIGGRVLYVAEHAPDLRTALEEAIESGAELQGADLEGAELQAAKLQYAEFRYAKLQGANFQGAKLQGTNFQGANFQYADLQGAELQAAELQGAKLQGAELQGAKLQGAYLQGADLQGVDLQGVDLQGVELQGAELQGAITPSHALWAFRFDLWSILDSAPVEAAGLRSALVVGDVDGSTYEGPCACLVGTLERVARALKRTIDVPHRAHSPAEMWFGPIRSGDVPVWLPAEEEISEGVFRASWALRWIEEWFESRPWIEEWFESRPQRTL